MSFDIDLTDDIPGAREAGIIVGLEYDQTPSNPRDEYDSPCVLWTKERDYTDYDERDKKGAWFDLSRPSDDEYEGFDPFEDWGETARRLRKFGCEVLFVMREPYSGGMATCESDDRPDGVIYCTHETVVKEWGGKSAKIATAKARALARKYMEAEIEEYSAYATGECYGYVVQRADLDEDGDETFNGDELNSCWGFYGDEYVREAAAEAAQYWIKKANEDRALVETPWSALDSPLLIAAAD